MKKLLQALTISIMVLSSNALLKAGWFGSSMGKWRNKMEKLYDRGNQSKLWGEKTKLEHQLSAATGEVKKIIEKKLKEIGSYIYED